MKHGFEGGVISGLLVWLYLNGFITLTFVPLVMGNLLTVIASFLFVLSILIGIISAFRGQATINTTVDGFIYGFTTAFDVPYIIIKLSNGSLPLP
jgi:hypothetical protein